MWSVIKSTAPRLALSAHGVHQSQARLRSVTLAHAAAIHLASCLRLASISPISLSPSRNRRAHDGKSIPTERAHEAKAGATTLTHLLGQASKRLLNSSRQSTMLETSTSRVDTNLTVTTWSFLWLSSPCFVSLRASLRRFYGRASDHSWPQRKSSSYNESKEVRMPTSIWSVIVWWPHTTSAGGFGVADTASSSIKTSYSSRRTLARRCAHHPAHTSI